MSGVSKIDIRESIETLKTLLSQQKSPEHFQKVQVLYLLKSKQAKTIKQAAIIVGRHRITVQGWLRCYRNGGIEALLAKKTGGGRKSSIPEWAIEILTEKLQKSPAFETYKEIQIWLETDLDLKVSYDVVHYLVHDKLKLSLKKGKGKNDRSNFILLDELAKLKSYFLSLVISYGEAGICSLNLAKWF